MTFEPNYEKIVSSVQLKAGETQTIVEARFAPTEDIEIDKVLCCNAYCYIKYSDIAGKDVNYGGVVSLHLIYLGKDGQMGSESYTTEFTDKYTLDTEYLSATPIVNTQVIESKAEVVGTEVKVTAIVEAQVDIVQMENVNVLTGFATDDVLTMKEELKYNTYTGLAYNKSDNTFDINLKDNAAKVLGVCLGGYIRKVTPFTNYVKVEGGIDVRLTYATDTQPQEVRVFDTTLDFTDEATLEGITDVSTVQSYLALALDELRITTAQDANNTIITLNLPLIYRGYVYNERIVEYVADLYSTTNFATISTESVKYAADLINVCSTDKLDGSLTIGENEPFIDELVGAVCNQAVVNNVSVVDNELIVEGVAQVCVLYNSKELNTISRAVVLLPYSCVLNGDYDSLVNANVQVAIADVSARSRRGKEIDVNAILYLYVNTYTATEGAVISSVEFEDEIPQSECAMSIVVAQDNDTLWDIAKREHISTDTILQQNPELELPINAGDRIVIYRQRLANFD